MVQCYQASATFADEMIGRLLDKLDETGKSENTIIGLWSDHENDPWEWNNLAYDKDYKTIIEEHRKWLPKEEAQEQNK